MLLAKPFRVFFLLAGGFAALWIPAWLVILLQGRPLSTNLSPIGWHGHEMVFGYTGAILAGFLLTAVSNWTKTRSLGGVGLLALVLLWCAGRVVALHTAALPPLLPVAIDAAFWVGLAAAIARPIIVKRSTRNLSFPALVLLLGACDAVLHLHVTRHVSPDWSARAMPVALDAIALIILIFAGRIVPLFTGKALGQSVRAKGWLDWLGLGAMTTLLACHILFNPNRAVYWLAVATGLLNACRLWGWGGAGTLGKPILWVLHLGWLFLSLSLTLYGVAGLVESVPPGAAVHLLTVGGIGVTTIGMMARVSLGHTGRKLRVPASVTLAFVIVVFAVLVRVGVPWMWPRLHLDAARVSGIAWAIGFAIFTARFLPIWLSPRADGKPG